MQYARLNRAAAPGSRRDYRSQFADSDLSDHWTPFDMAQYSNYQLSESERNQLAEHSPDWEDPTWLDDYAYPDDGYSVVPDSPDYVRNSAASLSGQKAYRSSQTHGVPTGQWKHMSRDEIAWQMMRSSLSGISRGASVHAPSSSSYNTWSVNDNSTTNEMRKEKPIEVKKVGL